MLLMKMLTAMKKFLVKWFNQVMYDKIHDLDVSDNEYEQKLNELNDCVTRLLDVTEKIGKSQEIAKEQVLNALKDIPDFAKTNYELKVDYDDNLIMFCLLIRLRWKTVLFLMLSVLSLTWMVLSQLIQ